MLFLILFVPWFGQAALAAQVKVGTPVELAQIDLGKMGGTLVNQLAWSPEGKELYLQTMTEDKKGQPKDRFHFVISAEGGSFKNVAASPDYAIAYWSWKSGQTAPDDLAFKIDVSVDTHMQSASAVPSGGDLAKGGANGNNVGATNMSNSAGGVPSFRTTVYTMLLKGEVIGEWTNHAAIPGATFGWGPAGTHLIAYRDKSAGRLVIMDSTGAKQKVAGTKDVIVPAWTNDSTRLAYLEGRGRNKYALVVATVSR